jgi:hypothetical protein
MAAPLAGEPPLYAKNPRDAPPGAYKNRSSIFLLPLSIANMSRMMK